MVKRQFTNHPTSPMLKSDGSPAVGLRVAMRLCVGDSDPDPTTVEFGGTTDAYTTELIISEPIYKTVDSQGFFSFDQWPNDRGSTSTQYLFWTDDTAFPATISTIPSAPTDNPTLKYTYTEFLAAAVSSAPPTPVEISLLNQHLNSLKHLPPGGTVGQVLTRTDPADYLAAWQTPAAVELGAGLFDPAGAAVAAVLGHTSAIDHSPITHTNRTALDAVTGTNTGDQDLSGLVPKSGATMTGTLVGKASDSGTDRLYNIRVGTTAPADTSMLFLDTTV
jgi:hypothetical protein